MAQDSFDLCPFLGVEDDRETKCIFSFPGHRCYRGRKAETISLEQQDQYCLSRAHRSCPLLPPGALEPVEPPTPKQEAKPAPAAEAALASAHTGPGAPTAPSGQAGALPPVVEAQVPAAAPPPASPAIERADTDQPPPPSETASSPSGPVQIAAQELAEGRAAQLPLLDEPSDSSTTSTENETPKPDAPELEPPASPPTAEGPVTPTESSDAEIDVVAPEEAPAPPGDGVSPIADAAPQPSEPDLAHSGAATSVEETPSAPVDTSVKAAAPDSAEAKAPAAEDTGASPPTSPAPADAGQVEPAPALAAGQASDEQATEADEMVVASHLTARNRGLLVLIGMAGTAAILLVAALIVVAMYGFESLPAPIDIDLPVGDQTAAETPTPEQSSAAIPSVVPTFVDAPLPVIIATPATTRTSVASASPIADISTAVTPVSALPTAVPTLPASPTPAPTIPPSSTPVPAPLTPGPAWQLRLGGAQLALTPVAGPTTAASPTVAAPAVAVPPPAATATPAPIVHRVVSGENLTMIARQYNTTVDEILAANDLPNQNVIYAGMLLTIPRSP